MTDMIRVENLRKNFGEFCALDGVDMHVPGGSIYGLVGPNGAGKTTLLRHIMGIYRQDEGSVLVEGKPVYEQPDVKKDMILISDDLFYFQQADTLEMKGFYKGIYPGFDEKLFERLQEVFRNIDVKRRIRKLSKGMQKQVSFWLGLCSSPRILILDEPVDGLDPVMRRQIWNLLLAEKKKRGMTVLVSSHNLRELEEVCDYVGIMHQGRIRMERSLQELQGCVSKVQTAFEQGMPVLPETFQVLHMSNLGRVYTMIVKGDSEKARGELEKLHPLFVDVLPLTLEEIFIYEMGGADYGIQEILL